jgi:hypothetical protein
LWERRGARRLGVLVYAESEEELERAVHLRSLGRPERF